jgi:hypothetical protein
MRCLRMGAASAATSSTDGARRPCSSARALTASASDWLARGPAPQAKLGVHVLVVRVRTGRAHQIEDGLDHAVADGQAAHEALGRHQLLASHGGGGLCGFCAGGLDQHAALGFPVRIADVDLHQEAVKLGFGQRIGALLLDRVLGGEHVERARQVVALASHCDVVFLHGLKQRRLGARAGAVDLVGHQQLGEDRALDEAEMAAALRRLVEHLGAENVGRHQIGRELHTPRRDAKDGAHGFDQPCLGKAGQPDQQAMATGQKRDQRQIDHIALAEDRLADLGPGLADRIERSACGIGHGLVEIDGIGCGGHGLAPRANRSRVVTLPAICPAIRPASQPDGRLAKGLQSRCERRTGRSAVRCGLLKTRDDSAGRLRQIGGKSPTPQAGVMASPQTTCRCGDGARSWNDCQSLVIACK